MGSSEHEEHLAVSRFRAIECRRSMVRAVNMGVLRGDRRNGRSAQAETASDQPGRPPTRGVDHQRKMQRAEEWPVSEWHQSNRWGILKAIVPIDTRFQLLCR